MISLVPIPVHRCYTDDTVGPGGVWVW